MNVRLSEGQYEKVPLIYREVSLYILFPEFKARFRIALEKKRSYFFLTDILIVPIFATYILLL